MKIDWAKYVVFGLLAAAIIRNALDASKVAQSDSISWIANFLSRCTTPDFLFIVALVPVWYFWGQRKEGEATFPTFKKIRNLSVIKLAIIALVIALFIWAVHQ